MLKRKGLTLIEVLICIAIAGALVGTTVLMLNTGLVAWRFTHDKLSIQDAAETTMNKILEGDFKYDGLREALDVWSTSSSSITIVPLYVDTFIVERPQKEFTLTKEFLPGAPDPLVKLKKKGAPEFKTVSPTFVYGEGHDPAKPDDKIIFDNFLKTGSRIKAMYHPDANVDATTRMSLRWDANEKTIYRIYKNKMEDLLRYHPLTQIAQLSFTYYDNAGNEIIPSEKTNTLTKAQRARISGVNVYMKLERKQDPREIISFVNIRKRSYQSTGMILTKGMEMEIPNSFDIVDLALANVVGVSENDVIRLEARSKIGTTSWAVELALAEIDGEIKVRYYAIEYPIGTMVLQDTVEQTVGGDRQFSFLTIDAEGLYDYDDDKDVKDLVLFKDDRVTFTVTRMDPDGAYLVVRP